MCALIHLNVFTFLTCEDKKTCTCIKTFKYINTDWVTRFPDFGAFKLLRSMF